MLLPHDRDALMGLPPDDAVARVEALGLFPRVISEDYPVITADRRKGRVNLFVKGGVVAEVWEG